MKNIISVLLIIILLDVIIHAWMVSSNQQENGNNVHLNLYLLDEYGLKNGTIGTQVTAKFNPKVKNILLQLTKKMNLLEETSFKNTQRFQRDATGLKKTEQYKSDNNVLDMRELEFLEIVEKWIKTEPNIKWDKMEKINLLLLLEVPNKWIINNTSGEMSANVVMANPTDVALAVQLANILEKKSTEEKLKFISSLDETLSAEVEDAIAREIFMWRMPGDIVRKLAEESGSLLYKYWLPQHFMKNKSSIAASKLITKMSKKLENLPFMIQRSWLLAAMEIHGDLGEWESDKIFSLRPLLLGSMPRELRSLREATVANYSLFKLPYTKLQARELFEKIRPLLATPSKKDKIGLVNLAYKLTPLQLQSYQKLDMRDRYSSTAAEMFKPEADAPFSTVLQITEFLLSSVPVNTAIWTAQDVKKMGKYMAGLPRSMLVQIRNEVLSETLKSAASDKLTRTQVRLLCLKACRNLSREEWPRFILELPDPYLKGVGVEMMLELPGDQDDSLKERFLPEASQMLPSARSSVIQWTRENGLFLDELYLPSVLDNDAPEVVASLFSPKEIQSQLQKISWRLQRLPEAKMNKYRDKIRRMPRNLLSLWLTWVRKMRNNSWSAEVLLGHGTVGMLPLKVKPGVHSKEKGVELALLGLSCTDVEAIEVLSVVTILGQYRQELAKLARLKPLTTFPSDLRKCFPAAVIKYLQYKADVMGKKVTGKELIFLLSKAEINAIGGGVLLELLSLEDLMSLDRRKRMEIMLHIGKMNVPDMLTATSRRLFGNIAQIFQGDMSKLPNDYQNYVSDVEDFGNLVHYLNPLEIPLKDLKLKLETEQKLENKLVCMTQNIRNQWATALQDPRVFGAIENWDAGDLVALGDMLIVLSPTLLKNVSRKALMNAVETLTRHTLYQREIEWLGADHPVTFLKACVKTLGEDGKSFQQAHKMLMREYLEATQRIVDTVARRATATEDLEDSAATSVGTSVNGTKSAEQKMTLTCEGIQAAGLAAMALTEGDLQQLSAQDLRDCLEALGIIPWEPNMRKTVWTYLKSYLFKPEIRVNISYQTGLLQTPEQDIRLTPKPDNAAKWVSPVQTVQLENVTEDESSVQTLQLENVTETMSTVQKPHTHTVLNQFGYETKLKAHVSHNSSWLTLNPEDVIDLGHINEAMDVADINMLKPEVFQSLDAVSVLGQTEWKKEQAAALAANFLTNSKGSSVNLTMEEVSSLGYIICGFPLEYLKKAFQVNSKLYLESSTGLGNLLHCSDEVLGLLAKFATREEAYGDVRKWTAEDVTAVGIVIAGLSPEELSKFKGSESNPVQGLRPSAVGRMTSVQLKAFPHELLASFTPQAAAVVTAEQMKGLTHKQKRALKSARAEFKDNWKTKKTETEHSTNAQEEPSTNGQKVSSLNGHIFGICFMFLYFTFCAC